MNSRTLLKPEMSPKERRELKRYEDDMAGIKTFKVSMTPRTMHLLKDYGDGDLVEGCRRVADLIAIVRPDLPYAKG